MKKGLFLGLALAFLSVTAGLGMAANSHDVTINIQRFAVLDVAGSASSTFTANDFNTSGPVAKTLNSTVKLGVRTNSPFGCIVSAAAPDFTVNGLGTGEKIPIGQLTLQVESHTATALANTSKTVAVYTGKTNKYPAVNGDDVAFTMSLTGNETAADNYRTTVTYTVVTNSAALPPY